MRSKLFILACALLTAAMLGTYKAEAQEPVPDFGEPSLLLLACNYAAAQAEEQNVTIRYCRQHSEEITGYQASVVVKISVINVGRFLVTVNFQKSLWSAQTWSVENLPTP